MIRRLAKLTVTALCLLSLLAAFGAGWLWWRSDHGGQDRVGVRRPDGRYTVRSRGGRLALTGPPPAGAAESRAAAAGWREYAAGYELLWTVFRFGDGETLIGNPVQLRKPGRPDDLPNDTLRDAPDAVAARALLDALEDDDPEVVATAHVDLTRRFAARAGASMWEWPAGLSGDHPPPAGEGRYYGLCVRFRPDGPPGQATDLRGHPVPEAGRIDPGQFRALGDFWHDRLDVSVASVAYGWVVAATAVATGLWLAARGRRAWARRRRTRFGLCVRCGYDLRGNESGRCPECGQAHGIPPHRPKAADPPVRVSDSKP